MSRAPSLSIPLPEPLALLDATLLFIIQVLLSRHPELFPPLEPEPSPVSQTRLRPQHRVLDAVRELQVALDHYRIFFPDESMHPEDFTLPCAEKSFPF
jgi:hypothetical protein